MADKQHRYRTHLAWTGNTGAGTASYRGYGRDHTLTTEGRPPLLASSDPAFRGNAAKWNPELLLLAALSSCHQLWYLHLCATAGIVVTAYADEAEGVMEEMADGAGQFTAVTLHPHVTVAPGADLAAAERLHHAAHAKCFIARSVNFPVTHAPRFTVATG